METNTTSWWRESDTYWRGQTGRWSFQVVLDKRTGLWHWMSRDDHTFCEGDRGFADWTEAKSNALSISLAAALARRNRMR